MYILSNFIRCLQKPLYALILFTIVLSLISNVAFAAEGQTSFKTPKRPPLVRSSRIEPPSHNAKFELGGEISSDESDDSDDEAIYENPGRIHSNYNYESSRGSGGLAKSFQKLNVNDQKNFKPVGILKNKLNSISEDNDNKGTGFPSRPRINSNPGAPLGKFEDKFPSKFSKAQKKHKNLRTIHEIDENIDSPLASPKKSALKRTPKANGGKSVSFGNNNAKSFDKNLAPKHVQSQEIEFEEVDLFNADTVEPFDNYFENPQEFIQNWKVDLSKPINAYGLGKLENNLLGYQSYAEAKRYDITGYLSARIPSPVHNFDYYFPAFSSEQVAGSNLRTYVDKISKEFIKAAIVNFSENEEKKYHNFVYTLFSDEDMLGNSDILFHKFNESPKSSDDFIYAAPSKLHLGVNNIVFQLNFPLADQMINPQEGTSLSAVLEIEKIDDDTALVSVIGFSMTNVKEYFEAYKEYLFGRRNLFRKNNFIKPPLKSSETLKLADSLANLEVEPKKQKSFQLVPTDVKIKVYEKLPIKLRIFEVNERSWLPAVKGVGTNEMPVNMITRQSLEACLFSNSCNSISSYVAAVTFVRNGQMLDIRPVNNMFDGMLQTGEYQVAAGNTAFLYANNILRILIEKNYSNPIGNFEPCSSSDGRWFCGLRIVSSDRVYKNPYLINGYYQTLPTIEFGMSPSGIHTGFDRSLVEQRITKFALSRIIGGVDPSCTNGFESSIVSDALANLVAAIPEMMNCKAIHPIVSWMKECSFKIGATAYPGIGGIGRTTYSLDTNIPLPEYLNLCRDDYECGVAKMTTYLLDAVASILRYRDIMKAMNNVIVRLKRRQKIEALSILNFKISSEITINDLIPKSAIFENMEEFIPLFVLEISKMLPCNPSYASLVSAVSHYFAVSLDDPIAACEVMNIFMTRHSEESEFKQFSSFTGNPNDCLIIRKRLIKVYSMADG